MAKLKGTLKNRYFHQSSDSKPLIADVYCRRKPYFSKCPKEGLNGYSMPVCSVFLLVFVGFGGYVTPLSSCSRIQAPARETYWHSATQSSLRLAASTGYISVHESSCEITDDGGMGIYCSKKWQFESVRKRSIIVSRSILCFKPILNVAPEE